MYMQNVFLVQHVLKNMAEDRMFCNKQFIVDGDKICTYYEFYNRSLSLSYYISKKIEISKGDRVLVLIDNSLEFYVSFLAILLLGGVAVPLSNKSSYDRIYEIVIDCSPSLVICASNRLVDECARIKEKTPVINVKDAPLKEELDDAYINNCLIDSDLAMIIYTSGSTGKRKGIVCSHLNIISALKSISSYLELKETDVVLNALPPFFDYGLYQFLLCSFCGAKLVLERNFIFADSIVKSIIDNKVTVIPLMPTIASSLCEYISKTDYKLYSFEMVRMLTSTGARLYKSQIDDLKNIFKKAKIFSMYGMTECKRVSYLNPDLIEQKPDSVGKPMPNVDIDIVDDFGNSVGYGQVGTLIVRGSNVCMGYWNDTELTEKVFISNQFNQKMLVTNDLFYRDKDGELYFVGRKDDIVKCNGFRISLQEISHLIMDISDVKETFIEAKDDEKLGKKLTAYIVLHEGSALTVRQIRNKLLNILENSALCPHEFVIVDSLQVSENGKISCFYKN